MHEDERQRALEWLDRKAKRLGYVVYHNLTETREPWLHVTVGGDGDKDAYDAAVALQKLEDAWNVPQKGPPPYWKLNLLPGPTVKKEEAPPVAGAAASR